MFAANIPISGDAVHLADAFDATSVDPQETLGAYIIIIIILY